MSLFTELKRRNVFRVGIAYVVVAWLLLQVSDTLVPALRLPDWFHSGVTLLLLLGLPVALLFAWAYELTPEGLKKEKEIDRSKSITGMTGRKLDRVIIVLLVITVGYFAVDKFVLVAEKHETDEPVAAADAPRSVAVLPFVPMSSGEDDDYFADGLTEEILNALAQLPELQVTARTSSFFFKGQNIPIPEIATRLQVAHIVEGSVRRAGEEVRITAQLIRAADGFHLWSKTYDRTLEHVFAVQEDIAENIANALDIVLDDQSREAMRSAGIRDVDAFIDYQKGLEAFAAAHESAGNITEALVTANVYFERALEAAPELVAARVLKADLASHVVFDFAAGRRVEAYSGEAEEALAAVREELEMAWRVAPNGNQRDVLDLERTMFLDDWRGVSTKAGKALQLGQCSELNWTTEFVGAFGWAEEITEKYSELLVCDPVNFGANVFRSFLTIWRGVPSEGLQMIRDARSRGFEHPWLDDVHFLALVAAGRIDDPAVQAPQPEISGMQFDRRITLEALSGNDALARQLAEEHWAQPGVGDWSSLIVAALVGDRDKANEHAARMDARPGGPMVLSSAVFNCYCGAPFDLDVTPNFKTRIEEAGFPWPPRTGIDTPTKTW